MPDDIQEPIEEEEEVFTLVDDSGNENDFTLAEIVRVDDQRYAILLPVDPGTVPEWEPGDALIMRIVDEDGEDVLVQVETQEELERVAEAWDDLSEGETYAEDEVDEEQ